MWAVVEEVDCMEESTAAEVQKEVYKAAEAVWEVVGDVSVDEADKAEEVSEVEQEVDELAKEVAVAEAEILNTRPLFLEILVHNRLVCKKRSMVCAETMHRKPEGEVHMA